MYLPPNPKWVNRWMKQAELAATMSKDPSTKCGAVLVRPDGKGQASDGYNGFPPNHSDEPRLYADREYKYKHIIHAEDNAFRNSRDANHRGHTLFCWPFPTCEKCAKIITSEGVTTVVFPQVRDPDLKARWQVSLDAAMEEYRRKRVTVIYVRHGRNLGTRYGDPHEWVIESVIGPE